MIKRLRVNNFKALRDVEIELTPIHVLIGPNDSGKTSILDALAALCRSVDHELPEAFLGSWKGAELVWGGQYGLSVTLNVAFNSKAITGYAIDVTFEGHGRYVKLVKETVVEGDVPVSTNGPSPWELHGERTWVGCGASLPGQQLDSEGVKSLLEGVHYYRWNPQFLALPVAPDTKRRYRMESNGFGLALCLDEILSYDREQFAKLETRFTKIFPHINSIVLQQEPAYRAPVDNPEQVTMLQEADGKGLYFRLKDGDQLIPASQASDGTLLVLAYLSILYLPKPPRVLLVEEPENGIHPKRLRDILTILRELIGEQSHTQVLLTTHSPYVVDLFEPEEVTLCTKLDNGEVKTTRLSESPTIRKQIDVFTLGEIWTAEDDETIANTTESVEGSHE